MPVRLPPTDLVIPPAWSAEDEAKWAELSSAAHLLLKRTVLGDAVENSIEELRPLLLAGNIDKTRELVATQPYARALTWLWGETDGDCRDTINSVLLGSLVQSGSPLSPLVVRQLEFVYFDRFDELDSLSDSTGGNAVRQVLAEVLRRSWVSAGKRDPLDVDALSAEDAPRRFADRLLSGPGTVADAFRTWPLDSYGGGRFAELIHQYVLLNRLRTLEPGADDPVLDEVIDSSVCNALHVHGMLLGHAALTILIDAAGGEYPGDRWRDVVIAVAGDPRMSYTETYHRWWSVLGDRRAERVTAWLARADLSLFLEMLERFSKEAGQEAMRRMLPRRRILLEGLVKAGIVRRSRLFLGETVRQFLIHGAFATRDFAPAHLVARSNEDREKALLYLDCGEFHLIEGSHNTKLWVYLALPSPRIIDPRIRSFSYRDLTRDLADGFERRLRLTSEQEGRRYHTGLPHQQRGWLYRFLEFLATAGIYVDPEAILSAEDYRWLRNVHGLPQTSVPR